MKLSSDTRISMVLVIVSTVALLSTAAVLINQGDLPGWGVAIFVASVGFTPAFWLAFFISLAGDSLQAIKGKPDTKSNKRLRQHSADNEYRGMFGRGK